MHFVVDIRGSFGVFLAAAVLSQTPNKATVRAPRRSHTVRPVLQSMGKLLAASAPSDSESALSPGGWVGGNASTKSPDENDES